MRIFGMYTIDTLYFCVLALFFVEESCEILSKKGMNTV